MRKVVNKGKNLIERGEKGCPYHFISICYWKVCITTDQYLSSDDERVRSWNYFRDERSAIDCFQAIVATYEKPLKELEEDRKRVVEAFENHCVEKVEEAAKLNAQQGASAKRKVSFILGIVKLHEKYKGLIRDINTKEGAIHKECARMIVDWQKSKLNLRIQD